MGIVCMQVQVSVETTNDLGRKATITVPSQSLEGRIDERLKDIASSLKLPGFRPGKVPMKEVRRRFDAELRQEVAAELSRSSFADAISQENLSLAGQVTIHIVSMEIGRDLEYVATFEVMPEIELVDLATLKIRNPVTQIEEADIDVAVESISKQRRQWHPVERPAANNDRLHVDFAAKVGGEIVARHEDMTLVLGEEIDGRDSKALHDVLMGAAVGETRVFPTTFASPPDNHDAPAAHPVLADETVAEAESVKADHAVAEVVVRSIEESHLPEVDDEFVKWFGIEPGESGLAQFRAAVREMMELELAKAKRRVLKREVVMELAKKHDFAVPEALLDAEYQAELKRLQQISADAPEQAKTACLMLARLNLSAQLVMREIIAQESVRLDDQLVRQRIDEIANSYEESAEVRRFLYGDEEQLQNIERSVLEEQVLDLVLSRAEQVAVPMSYQEMMVDLPRLPVDAPDALDAPDVPDVDVRDEQTNVASMADAAEAEPEVPTEQEYPADVVPVSPSQAEAPKSGLLSRFFKRGR